MNLKKSTYIPSVHYLNTFEVSKDQSNPLGGIALTKYILPVHFSSIGV